MAAEYIVKIKNRAGVKQFDLTGRDFFALDYGKYLNGYGILNVDLPGDSIAIDALQKDGQIEIHRFDDNAGIDPYCDFYGLYRDRDRSLPSNTLNGIFKLKAVEQKHYLWRAVTGHPAGTNLRNDFTSVPGETALKLLVKYNCTASATLIDGRKRVPTWVGLITVQADGATGSDITKAFAHRKVLDCLQEIAGESGIDFDLVKTGARAWEFRTGVMGSDLTANVKFSAAWDNLGDPQLIGDAMGEETVAMTWGGGEGAARDFLEVHGPNYTADYNDIECYVDAVNQDTASLEAAGLTRMRETQARDNFRFGVKQDTFRYGRDYCVNGTLGDIVAVTFYEGTGARRIRGAHVAVTASSGGTVAEQIQLDTVLI